jgi:hypothetical protein
MENNNTARLCDSRQAAGMLAHNLQRKRAVWVAEQIVMLKGANLQEPVSLGGGSERLSENKLARSPGPCLPARAPQRPGQRA